MHDIGVVAVHKDGRFGFKILAGGGLGHKPYHALTVEEFVEEKELLASMEAILTLHNKYSDRKRRARASNSWSTNSRRKASSKNTARNSPAPKSRTPITIIRKGNGAPATSIPSRPSPVRRAASSNRSRRAASCFLSACRSATSPHRSSAPSPR